MNYRKESLLKTIKIVSFDGEAEKPTRLQHVGGRAAASYVSTQPSAATVESPVPLVALARRQLPRRRRDQQASEEVHLRKPRVYQVVSRAFNENSI